MPALPLGRSYQCGLPSPPQPDGCGLASAAGVTPGQPAAVGQPDHPCSSLPHHSKAAGSRSVQKLQQRQMPLHQVPVRPHLFGLRRLLCSRALPPEARGTVPTGCRPWLLCCQSPERLSSALSTAGYPGDRCPVRRRWAPRGGSQVRTVNLS